MFRVFLFSIILGLSFLTANGLEAILRGRLPSPQFVTTAVYDGNDAIYIMGGLSTDLAPLLEVLKYNITTEVVSVVATFPMPYTYTAAAIDSQGDIYHFGGMDTVNFEIHSTIYKLSKEDRTPVEIGQLPAALSYAGCTALGTDEIYVVGGFNREGYQPHVILFNSTTHEASKVADFPPLVRPDITVATELDGTIYIFDASPFTFMNSTQKIRTYDPVSGSIELFPMRIPLAIMQYSVVTDKDEGIIYIVGGEPLEPNQDHAFAKINVANQTYESLAVSNLPSGLHASSAVYVPKLRRIYSIGGSFGRETIDSIFGIDV